MHGGDLGINDTEILTVGRRSRETKQLVSVKKTTRKPLHDRPIYYNVTHQAMRLCCPKYNGNRTEWRVEKISISTAVIRCQRGLNLSRKLHP